MSSGARYRRLAFSFVALGVSTLPFTADAAPRAVVSLLEGRAEILRQATGEGDDRQLPWKPLDKGAGLAQGDTVRTSAGGRLELTLADGSRLRLGPDTRLTLERHRVGKADRSVGVAVWVGRVWAKVARRLGGNNAFEVRTQNAVAGVRGTSFTVVAMSDLSAIVQVYTGTVGVKKLGADYRARERKQVPGPERVDKKQWEEIIVTSMKKVQISALGEIAPAQDFEPVGEEVEWAQWNQKLDAQVR